MLLTFSPTVDVDKVTVTIIDDAIHEGNEIFLGLLDPRDQPVITNPDVATVTIIDDNDRKFIIQFQSA